MKFKIIPNEQTPPILSWMEAEEFPATWDKMIVKFLSFASRQHNCAGLASNQVSCNGQRLMIPFFAIKDKGFWDIVIAPKIVEYRGTKQEKIEGCLTWLGKDIIAERYPEIVVKYHNFKGPQSGIITGFEAQVWQHEYNHLKGINEIVRSRSKR